MWGCKVAHELPSLLSNRPTSSRGDVSTTGAADDAVKASRLRLSDLVRRDGTRRYGQATIKLHRFTCGAGSISPARRGCPDLGPARRGHQSKQPCATDGHPTPDRSNQTITELAIQERRLCI